MDSVTCQDIHKKNQNILSIKDNKDGYINCKNRVFPSRSTNQEINSPVENKLIKETIREKKDFDESNENGSKSISVRQEESHTLATIQTVRLTCDTEKKVTIKWIILT